MTDGSADRADVPSLQKSSVNTHGKYTNAYVGILNTYNKQIKKSVKNKIDLKEKFFKMIRFVMYCSIWFFCISILASFVLFTVMAIYGYQSVAIVTGAVTTLVSSFVTLISSIISLPQIIAKYLFNKEEDQLMNDVIKNIQDYELEAVKKETERLIRMDKLSEEDRARVNQDGEEMEKSKKTLHEMPSGKSLDSEPQQSSGT